MPWPQADQRTENLKGERTLQKILRDAGIKQAQAEERREFHARHGPITAMRRTADCALLMESYDIPEPPPVR